VTTLVSGACIRLYSTGPEYHIDPEHSTIGLIDTSTPPTIDSSGYLEIKLINSETDVPNGPVVAMTAASDETLTGLGIFVGCSNGGEIVRMRFYKIGVGPLDLNNPSHWAMVDGPYSNLWLTLVHDVAEAA